jgi:acetyl esterase/lipase
LLVDYRLAPEHPFPAGLDDATAVVRQLRADGVLQADRWALAGDSAGGGMALAVCQRLRDAGEPLPRATLLMSPWLDVTMENPDIAPLAPRDPMICHDATKVGGMVYAWEHDPKDPLVSPAYCDPVGLPPMLIHTGSEEVLTPDIRRFAERVRRAGVDVTYVECHGGFHVYVMAPVLPEARRAVREQLAFLRERADRSERAGRATA